MRACKLPRIFLVNPSVTNFGFSLITPRWLFVIAQATPSDITDEPILIDESIERFKPEKISPGDVVGVGLTTGNCARGYQIIKEVKSRGGLVVAGGIHATIFPNEPLDFGADAVVTGNGDLVWPAVVKDLLVRRQQKIYTGGRVPGDQLLTARWDLIDSKKYLTASVQTIAGCPENCSFCSVWVTDGRSVRQRLTEKIIFEVNQLYDLGFRYILFADDNFNPATLGRIEREPNPQKRKEFEKIRNERLKFFDEYSHSVPEDIYGFTQMTSELAKDPEYLEAMYKKMRIRGGLIGVESFTKEGLKNTNKQWNPAGEDMVRAIRTIQDRGIIVLSSVISGLESETLESMAATRRFIKNSGTNLAQFVIYSPYPGTVDFLEMTRKNNRATSLLRDKFWLDARKPAVLFKHPKLEAEVIIEEVRKSWRSFYSLPSVLKRALKLNWSWQEKFWFIVSSFAFRYMYAKDGVSSDSVRSQRIVIPPRLVEKLVLSFNSWLKSKNKLNLNPQARC